MITNFGKKPNTDLPSFEIRTAGTAGTRYIPAKDEKTG